MDTRRGFPALKDRLHGSFQALRKSGVIVANHNRNHSFPVRFLCFLSQIIANQFGAFNDNSTFLRIPFRDKLREKDAKMRLAVCERCCIIPTERLFQQEVSGREHPDL